MPSLRRSHLRLPLKTVYAAAAAALSFSAPLFPASSAHAGARSEERVKSAGDIARLATNLADLEATVRVVKFDSAEMEKIGSDFKTT